MANANQTPEPEAAVWKLYEVWRNNREDKPAGTGSDMVFFVRAQCPEHAALVAEDALQRMPESPAHPYVDSINEIGADASVIPVKYPGVIRGPFYDKFPDNKGWRSFWRFDPEGTWEESKGVPSGKMWFLVVDSTAKDKQAHLDARTIWMLVKLIRSFDILERGRLENFSKKEVAVIIYEDEARRIHQRITENILPKLQAGDWSAVELPKSRHLEDSTTDDQDNTEIARTNAWGTLTRFAEFCRTCDDFHIIRYS